MFMHLWCEGVPGLCRLLAACVSSLSCMGASLLWLVMSNKAKARHSDQRHGIVQSSICDCIMEEVLTGQTIIADICSTGMAMLLCPGKSCTIKGIELCYAGLLQPIGGWYIQPSVLLGTAPMCC